MSQYPEIPTNEIRIIDSVSYAVRKYGLNGVVFEEELVPLPTEIVTKVLNPDGTENLALTTTEVLVKG